MNHCGRQDRGCFFWTGTWEEPYQCSCTCEECKKNHCNCSRCQKHPYTLFGQFEEGFPLRICDCCYCREKRE